MWVFEYLAREYKKTMYANTRHLVLMSAVVAATIVLASIMPSLWFNQAAALLFGRFDAVINGPITAQKLKLIEQNPNIRKVVHTSLGSATISAGTRATDDVSAFFYEKASDLDLTWFSPPLLISGSQPKQGELAIDWYLARLLKVKPGQRIKFQVRFPDSVYKADGRVAGVYAPTTQTSNMIVAPYTQKLRKALILNSDGVLYSDLFIKTNNIPALRRFMSKRSLFINETLIERDSELRATEQSLNKIVNQMLRTGATYLAIAVYLFFILREQWVRLEKRRKNTAILVALGLESKQLFLLNFIEQAFIALITTAIGFWGGRYIMENMWSQYLPSQISLRLLGIIIVINMLVFALSAVQIFLKIRYLPVTKLLAQE